MNNHYNNTPYNYLIPISSMNYSFNLELGHVWPPRLYPCSFCRREFRSAQALGGHMNVHRRDRAKLKQSNPPSQEIMDLTLSDLKTNHQANTRKINWVDYGSHGEVVMCKRYKKSGVPFFNCSSSSSREEIDLELRLGDPRVVK